MPSYSLSYNRKGTGKKHISPSKRLCNEPAKKKFQRKVHNSAKHHSIVITDPNRRTGVTQGNPTQAEFAL
jgi:hypothetical protein